MLTLYKIPHFPPERYYRPKSCAASVAKRDFIEKLVYIPLSQVLKEITFWYQYTNYSMYWQYYVKFSNNTEPYIGHTVYLLVGNTH